MSEDRYKIYLEERSFLVTSKHQSATQLDKAILTLSGGAFGISMVFLRDIVSINKITGTGFLVWAWSLLIVSMLMTLFSFLFSQCACERAIKILEEDFLSDNDGPSGSNIWSCITQALNFISIIAFTLGLFFLIVFAIKNF